MEFIPQIYGDLCSPCSSWGRQHVNGVNLHFEQTGGGKHGVLLLPGALGKYGQQHGCAQRRSSLIHRPLPQEALGRILVLS